MRIIFLFSILSFLILGCSKHYTGRPLQVTFSDSGKTITLQPSQCIEINLVENASEGKVWGISPYTTNVIGFISSKFEPDENIVGAGGHRIIRFKALNYGTSKLEIIYYNTSKPEIEPAKIFKITVNVKKNKE